MGHSLKLGTSKFFSHVFLQDLGHVSETLTQAEEIDSLEDSSCA